MLLDETLPHATFDNVKLLWDEFQLYISLSTLTMSSVGTFYEMNSNCIYHSLLWRGHLFGKTSFKQPCILTCFVGWTFVFETLECGDILAARISANPKVIFVHPPNNPPSLGGKNEPTRRMCWKQLLWCHSGIFIKHYHSTWSEWKWNVEHWKTCAPFDVHPRRQ